MPWYGWVALVVAILAVSTIGRMLATDLIRLHGKALAAGRRCKVPTCDVEARGEWRPYCSEAHWREHQFIRD